MKKKYELLNNGWIVHDKEMYDFFTKNNPPRNSIFIKQFLADLKSRPTLLLIIASIVSFISFIFMKEIYLLVLGIVILVIYLLFFLKSTLDYRMAEIKVGNIETLEPHDLYQYLSVTNATTEDSLQYPVTLHSHPAQDILMKNQKILVMFPYTPKSQYSYVIAIRECNDVK